MNTSYIVYTILKNLKGNIIKKFKKVHIEITNICNLKCTFCPPKTLPNGIMNLETFDNLNEQLKPYLLNLESNFVLAKLDSILNLNGYYSKRFYLLLAQYKKMQKLKNIKIF